MDVQLIRQIQKFLLLGIKLIFFFAVIATPALAEPARTLEVLPLRENEIEIKGRGFAPKRDILVSIDLNEPHASLACYSDWTRIVLIKDDGQFDIFLAVSAKSGCGQIKCSRPGKKAEYVISVEDRETHQELAKAELLCKSIATRK